jgi:hypothetical protein
MGFVGAQRHRATHCCAPDNGAKGAITQVVEPRWSARPYGGVVGEAIGQVLSLGAGVALSPVPIIAVVLMLGTPRARANGPAFVLGWVIGLAVVGTIVLDADDRHVHTGQGAGDGAPLTLTAQNGDTTISGHGFDAARLGGVLRTIERPGLELVAVRSFVEGERAY